MASKKKQHLVPACYLKNFVASISKMQMGNAQFQSGIYVSNKEDLSEWKLRSVKHNSFVKSYFYNIEGDDPKVPIVEEFLSGVESEYPKVFKEIQEGKVNNKNLSFMSYFIMLQFMRVERFINISQQFYKDFFDLIDNVDFKQTMDTEIQDLCRLHLMKFDFGSIIRPHASIIYNLTDDIFLTTDNPVVRDDVNISDIRKIVPARYLKDIKDEGIESVLFYFPLSPKMAYISCSLINDLDKLYYIDSDIENIFILNCMSTINADKHVYASVYKPMKNVEEIKTQFSAKSLVTTIKVCTPAKRIIFAGEVIDNESFYVEIQVGEKGIVDMFKKGEIIRTLEIFENSSQTRFMQGCKVVFIDLETNRIIIEPNILLK